MDHPWIILAAVLYLLHTMARMQIRPPAVWPTIPSAIVRLLLFTSRWHANLANRADDGLRSWREHRRPIQPANERAPRRRDNLKLVKKGAANG